MAFETGRENRMIQFLDVDCNFPNISLVIQSRSRVNEKIGCSTWHMASAND
jgi:hypothetical protein